MIKNSIFLKMEKTHSACYIAILAVMIGFSISFNLAANIG
jgi:hypothetical protein